MRRSYESWAPTAATLDVVDQANEICRTYRAQGYDLTLRQLYYQFVARALLPNTDASYNRLGSLVAKARMAGLLDWSYITDRTRNLSNGLSGWDNPAELIESSADAYHRNLWERQPYYVEVWVEKEALAGVVGRAARSWRAPYFSCRGYVSLSEMHAAARRLLGHVKEGKRVVVLHLGDHDPSGIDMTRDIRDRLDLFTTTDWAVGSGRSLDPDDYEWPGEVDEIREVVREEMAEHAGHEDYALPTAHAIEVRRIALNMDQVRQYGPPPNPAKLTDARASSYVETYGRQSWELDALEPTVLAALIDEHVAGLLDSELWAEDRERERVERESIRAVTDRWSDVVAWIEGQQP